LKNNSLEWNVGTLVADHDLEFETFNLDFLNDQISMATNEAGMDELHYLGVKDKRR